MSGARESFEVLNTRTATLKVNSLFLSGRNAAKFSFDASITTCPLHGGAIAMDDSCSIGIAATPSMSAQERRRSALTMTLSAAAG